MAYMISPENPTPVPVPFPWNPKPEPRPSPAPVPSPSPNEIPWYGTPEQRYVIPAPGWWSQELPLSGHYAGEEPGEYSYGYQQASLINSLLPFMEAPTMNAMARRVTSLNPMGYKYRMVRTPRMWIDPRANPKYKPRGPILEGPPVVSEPTGV